MLVKEVQREIRAFMKAAGMSQTAFGLKVMNDARFVGRLNRDGADLKASTIDKIRTYIKRHGPRTEARG